MKNIKVVIAFILGLVISGVSVYALNIDARNTYYDNTNSGSSATNMQDAIDDLYERSWNASLIDCGTYSNNANINVSSYYDGDLSTLTSNNFVLELLSQNTGVRGWGRTGKSTYTNSIVKSFNNGTLTITFNQSEQIRYGEGADFEWLSASYRVWLIPSDFRN